MLYPKVQPLCFLGSEKKFLIAFTISRYGGHLVQWRGNVQTNCQYPFNRRPDVKSGEYCLRGFREEDLKNYTILYNVYSPGAKADNPLGTKF